MPPELLKTLVEVGSFGVLVYVLVHLLTRVMPAIFKAFTEAQETFKHALDRSNADATEQRKTFAEEAQRNRQAFAQQIDLLSTRGRERDEQFIRAFLKMVKDEGRAGEKRNGES